MIRVGIGDAFNDYIICINNMENKIIMMGYMPYEDIPELIASADICLLPAYNNEVMRDIVPIKLYEYLAMHKPVIATKLPGVMKEFGNGSGVIYIDKPEDVIKTVLEVTENIVKITNQNQRSLLEIMDGKPESLI